LFAGRRDETLQGDVFFQGDFADHGGGRVRGARFRFAEIFKMPGEG
jgi:hypothetical protein